MAVKLQPKACIFFIFLFRRRPNTHKNPKVRDLSASAKFFLTLYTDLLIFYLPKRKFYAIFKYMNKSKKNKHIPNSIKIGYTDYEFDFWPDTFASTEQAQGEFFSAAQKIGLKESTIPSRWGVNTLLHEVLHGIVYQYGLEVNSDEEKIVNTFANGLTTVLVDNPWLVDYIKKHTMNKNVV